MPGKSKKSDEQATSRPMKGKNETSLIKKNKELTAAITFHGSQLTSRVAENANQTPLRAQGRGSIPRARGMVGLLLGRELKQVGVAQKYTARVARILVFGSIYPGAMLVHVFEPQPSKTTRTNVLFASHPPWFFRKPLRAWRQPRILESGN